MKINKVIALILVICFIISTVTFAENVEDIEVKINGEYIQFDIPPIMQNDRVLVPLRKIFETLGAEITWEDSTQKITAKKDAVIISLKINDESAFIGANETKLSQPPILYNERTMVPLRFVSEAFGANVEWQDATNTVVITYQKKEKKTSMLGNVVEKLEVAKSLTIGYFGGSITDGTGSSNSGSWREKSTRYFKEKYPDAAITEINAGVGGTGSELGYFRVKHDLIEKSADLVFVEFAVNDDYLDSDKIQKNMEGIVRQLLVANPKVNIIFVYTAMEEWFTKYYESNRLPSSVLAAQKVADYYKIPSINMGKYMYDQTKESKEDVKNLLTDGVHPNNAGYAIYSKAVQEFFEKNLEPNTIGTEVSLPGAFTKKPSLGDMGEPGNAVYTGWTKQNNFKWKGYSYQLTSNVPKSELTYTFTGTSIGLYWLFSADSGNITWSVDDSPFKEASSFDHYASEFDRMNFTILSENLELKEHTLKIKVSDNKDIDSKGNNIRIGAFLIGTN